MLRSSVGVRGSTPPPELRLTESLVPNESRSVSVRVISFSSNWMFGSATRLVHGSGTLSLSALVAL